MLNIRPKNFKEAVNLKRCVTLQSMVAGLSDAEMEEIFYFLGENDRNIVSVVDDILSCRRENGETVKTIAITKQARFISVLLTATALKIARPDGTSNGDGDGGVSGNNNNNNNNNNNG